MSANFYDDWTYTETDAGFTTYFLKETGKGIKVSVLGLETGTQPESDPRVSVLSYTTSHPRDPDPIKFTAILN